MTARVRFAPSPTGLMHLGSARTALVNWLQARAHAGYLLLRIDDTDLERSDDAFVDAILADLGWLGLDWDETVRQRDRAGLYAAAFERLRVEGRVYPAYETTEELAAMRARQRALGRPPRYDRASLRLTDAARRSLEAEGRRPHWRFRLSDRVIAFEDVVRGPVQIELTHLSDPVVRREAAGDAGFTYSFASVVDDAAFAITDVIRGEDHLTNTGPQLDLLDALGTPRPRFAHLPLLLDAAGGKLSKRSDALSIRSLRERGIDSAAIVALLATLGTGRAPSGGLQQLLAGFDLAAYGKAQPRLDPAELERLTADRLRVADFASVQGKLQGMGLAGADRAFWEAIRGNLSTLADARIWWSILREPIEPVVTEPVFLADAAAGLAAAASAGAWLDALKTATGRTGKALFQPLRLALTGREHGPPLPDLIAMIGRDRAIRRLRGERC